MDRRINHIFVFYNDFKIFWEITKSKKRIIFFPLKLITKIKLIVKNSIIVETK